MMIVLLVSGLAGLGVVAVWEFWVGESERCAQEEARRARWQACVLEETQKDERGRVAGT